MPTPHPEPTTTVVYLVNTASTTALLHAYETGRLDHDDTVELFAELLRSGVINSLPGSYQRTAHRLITSGEIVPDPTAPAQVITRTI